MIEIVLLLLLLVIVRALSVMKKKSLSYEQLQIVCSKYRQTHPNRPSKSFCTARIEVCKPTIQKPIHRRARLVKLEKKNYLHTCYIKNKGERNGNS